MSPVNDPRRAGEQVRSPSVQAKPISSLITQNNQKTQDYEDDDDYEDDFNETGRFKNSTAKT